MTSAPPGAFLTDVKYELPPTIRDIRDGWIATLRISVIISTLFALAEFCVTPLIRGTVQAREEIGQNARGQALLTLTYVAILLNIGSAISAFVLTDEFGTLTLRASRCKAAGLGYLEMGKYDETYTELISRFNGGRRTWKWVVWYWMLITLLGYLCLVAQVVLYVWLLEDVVVKAIVLVAGAVAVLPLLSFATHLVPSP